MERRYHNGEHHQHDQHDHHGEHDSHDEHDHAPDGAVHATFEPCADHRGPDGEGPCHRCGWLAADHTAGLATVIEVGRPAPAALRRAS